MANIKDRVITIVANQLGFEESEVSMESHFLNDLGADALDTIELTMELEKEFGISIPDDAVKGMTTVGEAVNYLERGVN